MNTNAKSEIEYQAEQLFQAIAVSKVDSIPAEVVTEWKKLGDLLYRQQAFENKIKLAFEEAVTKCEDEGIMFDTPNWKPLEMFVPKEYWSCFMWMGTVLGGIEMYKHCDTRRYLNIDSNGKFFEYNGRGYDEVENPSLAIECAIA